MGTRLKIFEVLAILLIILLFAPNPIVAQTQGSNSLNLTVYLDGFVQIDQTVEFSQPVLSFNVTLISPIFQNIIIVDENNLPLEYTVKDNIASIYNVGSTTIFISYLTEDLTTKAGKYWTITTDYPESIVLVMPKNASIISINNLPDLIESVGGSLKLTMPTGLNEVIYTTDHAFDEQSRIETGGLELWQLTTIVALVLIVPLTLTCVLLRKRKKAPKPESKKDKKQEEVDLEKLLSKHRELRQDEIQVIKYLASKQGKAFEAELFELLNLPRTTTWRLIRRLESLEIVHIKKSRRQNIVLIRDKYLKKQ